MLVAKRDPYDFGAHDRPAPHLATAPTSSRFTRTLNILQMVGALIAVPAGIGSAYTMYKANFSPEASCKSLRANIVAVLDRSVDASTRHMLVRRDVEAFEQICGTVDPDATAAFRVLLAADKATPVVVVPASRAEPQPQAVVRKVEPAPAVKPKQPVARAAEPAARHDTSESDAAWVAAVRTALVKHEPEPAAAPAAVAPPTPIVAPHLFSEWRTAPVPAPPQAAPALPPPATVATTAAAPQSDPDRPVPPAAIPETQPPARAHSRLGELVGEIPFVGKTLADRVAR